MTPKTKKILIASGITIVLVAVAIGGYQLYKKSSMTRDIDVAQLTPEQRKKLLEQGVVIPASGTVPIKATEVTPAQETVIAIRGKG